MNLQPSAPRTALKSDVEIHTYTGIGFFNEETIKAILAFSHPDDIQILVNPYEDRCIEVFRYRMTFGKIVSGKNQWEWKTLMRSVIDEMGLKSNRGAEEKADGEREKIVHVISRLLTDMKFDNWSFDTRADKLEEKRIEEKGEEGVVDVMDIRMSCFIIAMASGEYEEIFQEFLKQEEGLDINFETTFFGTPLNTATRLGRVDLVEMLLEKEADPDVQSYDYMDFTISAREAAAQLGKLDIIRRFYDPKFPCGKKERGCQELRGCEELGIARAAALHGNPKIVSFLLDRHDHICVLTADENLMHAACQEGDLEMVKRFIKGGAEIWECDGWDGERPIVTAAKAGHLKIVEHLLDLDAENENQGGNAFNEAAANNHFDIVFMMFERGFREEPVDWDDEDEEEDELQFIDLEEAYQGAAINGNVEAAETIWEKYDDHRPREHDFCNMAFYSAVIRGHGKMIEWLVEKMGRDVDVYSWPLEHGKEMVPLVEALQFGRPEAVESLLKLGAKVVDVEDPGIKRRIEFEWMTPKKRKAIKVLLDWKEKM